ncbi:MAG: 3-deoxy-7-phosphoheptulonate synthase AroG [Cellvibrionaceae bacterium]|nr:3-deoxy-7-phosphoheptulonate synthase AroG [Cellvibrionaceae bacterium]
MHYNTDDLRIKNIKELLPPVALMERYPLTEKASAVVAAARSSIESMLEGRDQRLLVIVGPCSIHDVEAAVEYAERLKKVRNQYSDTLEIVMRVYFEKPRTTIGWKGLINDPYMDNSYQINDGLRIARKLMCDVNELGMPTAGEYLDTISPQYIADLMAWGAIGARTTESQCHRTLASGLSCPVGFKNGTDGNIKIAIDAIGAASAPHHFLSVTKYGHAAIVETTGNRCAHAILRGGKTPNYSAEHIADAEAQLAKAGLPARIMIDFSHANSHKDHRKQALVCEDVCAQVCAGNTSIFGVMIESHLREGNQKVIPGKELVYGQSVTDACIGWEETENLIGQLSAAASKRQSV